MIVLPLSRCRRCGWTQTCIVYRVGQNRVRVYVCIYGTMCVYMQCCRLTASMVNDADGVIYVKSTVKLVNYAVNRQSLVTPLFTIVIYGAIFEWRRMCTTLYIWYQRVVHSHAPVVSLGLWPCTAVHLTQQALQTTGILDNTSHSFAFVFLRAFCMHRWGAQKTVTPNHSFASFLCACYMHKWGAWKTVTSNHSFASFLRAYYMHKWGAKKLPRQITNMPLPPNSRCLQNSLKTLLLLILTGLAQTVYDISIYRIYAVYDRIYTV